MPDHSKSAFLADPQVGHRDVLTKRTLHRAPALARVRDPLAGHVEGDAPLGLVGDDGEAGASHLGAELQPGRLRDRRCARVVDPEPHPECLELGSIGDSFVDGQVIRLKFAALYPRQYVMVAKSGPGIDGQTKDRAGVRRGGRCRTWGGRRGR